MTMTGRSTTSGFWLQDGAFALKKISLPTNASRVGRRKPLSTKPRITSGGLTTRHALRTTLVIPVVFEMDTAPFVNWFGEPEQDGLTAPITFVIPFITNVQTGVPTAIAKLRTTICDGALSETCPVQPGS